jgi:hypothetical protein
VQLRFGALLQGCSDKKEGVRAPGRAFDGDAVFEVGGEHLGHERPESLGGGGPRLARESSHAMALFEQQACRGRALLAGRTSDEYGDWLRHGNPRRLRTFAQRSVG